MRSNLLDARFGRLLAQVQRFRELADYESSFTFTPEDAKAEVGAAREFVDAARQYLSGHGY